MYRIWATASAILEAEKAERRSDQLLVKRIQFEDFEGVNHFESSFDSQLAVLFPKIADIIIKAVGVILKSELLIGKKPIIKEGTEIKAEIEITGTQYYVTATGVPETNIFEYDVKTQEEISCDDFYEMIHQSAEEESLSLFIFDQKNRFSDKFKHYKDIEKYYPKKRFSELTGGIGDTRVFRMSLNNHIKENNQSKAEHKKLIIDDTGKIELHDASSHFDRELLSESDAMIFEFLSFINVNRFWQNIELIRDFNHINWPLFIFDLAERTDESIKLSDYLKKAISLKRQVFLCGYNAQEDLCTAAKEG